MKILDTDTLTFLLKKHPRAVGRWQTETEEIATTIINYIEALQGRFEMLLKPANGQELRRGQLRLEETRSFLARIPQVLPADASAADQFDRLLQNRKLRKIGRADMITAAITLANQATLVTNNLKDFRLVPGLRIENWLD